MINVALLSRWHVHADDYAKQAENNDHISTKLVWDEQQERGEQWAKELSVPFEADLDVVLRRNDIDAVIVNTPTNLHKEVILAAAENGKHIFTEKVLAFTLSDCEEIYKAVEKANIQLMVSLPRLTENYYLYAQEVLDQGLLGNLTTIRCRLAHNGAVPLNEESSGWLPQHFFNKEQCGGGALVDLGAHPIYLTNRLAGKAVSVFGHLQNTLGLEVDDNAVVLVEYESGVLGTLETGFLSKSSPFQLELYGTEGTLLIEESNIRLKSSLMSDQVGWFKPEQLPPALPMPIQQWTDSIRKNGEPSIQKEDVLGLTIINEAAALSNKEGRRISVTELKSTLQHS
ncbi:Gfo/Idh/MocA family protein [Fictibacillus phosphorivorans]|uniref:Gfo/Idh/MocA family protein n=1 Tax=Fictibacillus phosphorivorans TaxID=1221500 RepID=UPI00203C2EFC|nr:Gfo/Idh/MocA family oxidoreductase [Fictibacillus phosphorivorans]MCM3777017.1 Gfo/Idh/MocA family oxidoreductase [Fictibacillus phosphorivorans]